jgi:twitching motility protein PilT
MPGVHPATFAFARRGSPRAVSRFWRPRVDFSPFLPYLALMPGYDQELASIVAELNRAALGSRTTHGDAPQSTASLDQLLGYAVQRQASDLLLIAGAPVALRIDGLLSPAAGPPLGAEDTRNLLLPLLTAKQAQELQQSKSTDFCFSREAIGRFRANVHHQRGTLAGSIRLLPARIPTLESLHLPATLRRLAEARQGLILITGTTGCGKSSTLAALIDIINIERRDHIVTIEDPVEFVHGNRNSIVEQIEVGHDTPEFASSVRSIMRQTPDVILVGEMRDPETIATVLTAAETGHLVLSTLHTNDTSQAVSRILDSFPLANQRQIRQQLSLAMLALVAQQLVPTANGGGRCPAVEIMMGSHGVRNLIRKGEDHQLYTAIATGRADGMITMEQSLAELVRAGRITRETAAAHCFRPDDLARYLQS